MNEFAGAATQPLPPEVLLRLNALCNRFETAWKTGQRPKLEEYLSGLSGPEREALLPELLAVELSYRRGQGETLILAAYRPRLPHDGELLEEVFRAAGLVDTQGYEGGVPQVARPASPDELPVLGRYRALARLGDGTFGIVYKGYDEELRRVVALKVPHRYLISRPQDVALYVAEARVQAGLDHPHIVPVYDVGSTADGLCFVVSKLVEGSDLAKRLRQGRLSFAQSAELVAAVAEALHHAHLKGLVHRDVKPANILLDTAGRPYLADFGLALKEEDFGLGAGLVGTPLYMSPEQARGEGHRVDGRSDVFSLGVVFYELLTGRCPFRGETRETLLEQIATLETRPPRQVDDAIPRELERICLKVLAKRATERYTTAKDMAGDLRHFLAVSISNQQTVGMGVGSALTTPVALVSSTAGETASSGTPSGNAPSPASESQRVRIVPKGLRSFDDHDADFFLELLSGPRDRDGLPDSLRFWKTRIEEADPDQTFAVGLLYGPSGCGKSSLVKAGLLPRLGDQVVVVYVEATAEETETRLLRGLRRRCPGLPPDLGLVETLAALRRGGGLPAGQKVLLVLDQFEQWLHARWGEEHAALVQALRHCDGERVQCLVLVRDDFWMAVGRFLEELEVRLVQGENAAAVDLFDLPHARKVLAAFGRAFGALPRDRGQLTREQEAFLTQAVAGLAQDDRVICVRLALFAEMVKGRPWTPSTLKEVGGAAGVGVAFLEETFSAPTASPGNRLHQQAARAVLQLLLPEQGSDIKGHKRSREELLEASGYACRPGNFESLLRLLDGEVRLITPTEAAGDKDSRDEQQSAAPVAKYYQLTHDYLVHSLRDWLTRKQRETWRGRAELRLAERAAGWSAKPESRHLPAWWEWLNIRLCTHKKDWTPPQRLMMRQAGRYHAGCCLALLLVLLLLGWGGREVQGSLRAEQLIQLLLKVDTVDKDLPRFIGELRDYRSWAGPRLRRYLAYPEESKEHLHASLALLPEDEGQEQYLYRRLLEAEPPQLKVIGETLLPQRPALQTSLWCVLLEEGGMHDLNQRFRAACALATCAADDDRWGQVSRDVVNRLLDTMEEHNDHYPPLRDLFHPVRERLLGPLADVYRDGNRPQTERLFATSLLAEYVERPNELVELALDADENRFAVLWSKLTAHREETIALCEKTVAGDLESPLHSEAEKEGLARRQANAGVILLRFGQADQVWRLLRHGREPSTRSYLIQRLCPLGADPLVLVNRLKTEPDDSVRQALILALGEYTAGELPAAVRQPLVARLLEWYRDDPDPGIHGTIDWLLRHGKEGPTPRKLDWDGAGALAKIDRELAGKPPRGKHRWYVNGQGHTLTIVPGPVVFLMGSPTHERGHQDDEKQHWRRIGREFAIATEPVTVRQFQAFRQAHPEVSHTYNEQYSPELDGPIIAVNWYDAAAYCRWLSEQDSSIPRDQYIYPAIPDIQKAKKTGTALGLPADYLSRTGYRLPTEAEWEFVCRAGATSSRCYGSAEELLPRYAWYIRNSDDRAWPVGQKRPNDLGLFDMHGNVWQWCQERYAPYKFGEGNSRESPDDDVEDNGEIMDSQGCVLRGGAFHLLASVGRSAYRTASRSAPRVTPIGLRPARTLPPSP